MKRRSNLLSINLGVAFCIAFLSAYATPSLATERSIPITVTSASSDNLEVWQVSQGQLQALTSPMIAAEVGGRIISVLVDVGNEVKAGQLLAQIDAQDFRLDRDLVSADIDRLDALIKAQELQVKRFQQLVKQKSANQSALDDAEAQLGSLKAQLVGSKVRLQQAERNITKTGIISPVSGRINQRKISVGDYLNKGTQLFQVTRSNNLQAWLSFPESLSSSLQIGQLAHLTSPVKPGQMVESKITEIRPEISASNHALTVLIDIDNPGGWEPGASVTGKVRVTQHSNAIVVPEGCVIRRPSGLVVYKIEQGKASEVAVTTGIQENNKIEILSGVQPGDQLALDGAAFLTEGVSVEIKQNSAQGEVK